MEKNELVSCVDCINWAKLFDASLGMGKMPNSCKKCMSKCPEKPISKKNRPNYKLR